MNNLEDKIELANWLDRHNHQVALSGSLMLYLYYQHNNWKFPLEREPRDIDIVVDYDTMVNDDEFIGDFCLPPFMEEVDIKDVNGDGYPVIKRFKFYGLKIEFLYSYHYRSKYYHISYLKLAKVNGKEKLVKGVKDWNWSIIFDLLGAKYQYIKDDSNEQYINKCKDDIEKICESLYENNFNWEDEYIDILSHWIYKKLYFDGNDIRNEWKERQEFDWGRYAAEQYIKKYIVKDNLELQKWFEFIQKFDYKKLQEIKEKEKIEDKGGKLIYSFDDILPEDNNILEKIIINKEIY